MRLGLLAPTTWKDWRVFLCAWAVVFVLAVGVDRAVATLAAPDFFAMKVNMLARVIEHAGRTWFLACVMLLLVALHPRRLRAAAFVFTSSAIGAVLGAVLKWMVGRTRPVADMVVDIRPFDFDFFRGGIHGLFEQQNLCFPSGHAIQVFSLMACLSLLYPRLRHAWLAVALAVAFERIIELAHYPSDVVAAALVAAVSFLAAAKLFRADSWPPPGASGSP
jgi:membrane-associated phospholipid phosphatase